MILHSMTEHVDILSETEYFHSISSEDVMNMIDGLSHGDVGVITHGFLVGRFGDETIMVDPAIRANLKKDGRFTQMRNTDHLRSNLPAEKYSNSIFGAEDLDTVAATIAPKVDKILITHLDSDHIDFDFIEHMMRVNEKLEVYGPLGWEQQVFATHVFEDESNPKKKPVLSDHIRLRLHGLSPVHTLGDKPKGLAPTREERPLLYDELHTVHYEHSGVKTSISSFDTPHFGGSDAEHVQSFLIESGDQRQLIISDSALSPEIMTLVQKLHTEKKLTSIITSVAKFNAEPYAPLFTPKFSDKVRNAFEEKISHTILLPFVLAAITNAEVPIRMTHFGFYHNSIPDMSKIGRRFTFSSTDIHEWCTQFSAKIDDIFQSMNADISKLGMLTTFFSEYNPPPKRRIRDMKTRHVFVENILSLLVKAKKDPKSTKPNIAPLAPPESLLESKGGPISLPIPLTAMH